MNAFQKLSYVKETSVKLKCLKSSLADRFCYTSFSDTLTSAQLLIYLKRAPNHGPLVVILNIEILIPEWHVLYIRIPQRHIRFPHFILKYKKEQLHVVLIVCLLVGLLIIDLCQNLVKDYYIVVEIPSLILHQPSI